MYRTGNDYASIIRRNNTSTKQPIEYDTQKVSNIYERVRYITFIGDIVRPYLILIAHGD